MFLVFNFSFNNSRTALTGLEQLDYRKLETLIGQLDLNDIQFALYQCNEVGIYRYKKIVLGKAFWSILN